MFRARTWMAATFLGTGRLGLTACNFGTSGSNSSGGGGAAAAPADIGAPLYKAEAMPPAEKISVTPEPIVIPNAVVQSDVRVQVAAQVDSVIELIATPLPPGAKYDPNDPEITFHPRDEKKTQPYRKLRENDVIKAGQILARQDEQLVAIQMKASKEIMERSDESIAKNEIAADRYLKQLEALAGVAASTSKFERYGLEATVARLEAEVVTTKREKAKSMGEYLTANAQLARYWVVSPINGRVTRLLKQKAEYAKAGDPILEIQATDRVRIEGKMDIQYAGRVRKGMRVIVEPTRPVSPELLSINHRGEVASIAVTAHKGRPMIVTAGLDSSVLVWDVIATKQYFRLPHPVGVGVRTVACTGPLSKTHYIATGTEDGKVRLWDVSNPDKMPTAPVAETDASHESAVTAAAFSPDGRFLATAAGRDVFVWDLGTKRKMYAIPAEHRDAVTTVSFTPQGTLVTASRDKSIRVWKLGDKGASSEKVIDHRGGSVDVLGVSSTGGKVLFDKDPGRLDVVSLADERSVGTVLSPTGGARFATLALFSPGDKLIVTGGGDMDQRGELTLWDAPQPGGRGAERRRLMTPKNTPITCAAFSPDPEHRFVAVGTSMGGVYFWTVAAAEKAPALAAEIVFVQQADARSMVVRVELPNPVDKFGEGLQERSLATIIIDPSAPVPEPGSVLPGTAALPPINPIVPAGGAITPGGVIQTGGVVNAGGIAGPPAPMSPVNAIPPGAAPVDSPPPQTQPLAEKPKANSVLPAVTAPPLPEKK